MPFSTVTVPITANPAADIVTAIEGVLATHSNWSFVESVTQTDVHRIWKCSGTNNIAGTDFYLAFVLPSTVTTLGVKLFEAWDTSAKRMGKQTPNNTSALPVAGDLTTGTSGLLLTDSTTSGQPYSPTRSGLSTSASHVVNVFVTKSRLVVTGVSSNNFTLVAGAFPVQAAITDSRFKNIAMSFVGGTTIGSTALGGSTSGQPSFTRSLPVGGGSCWDFGVLPVAFGTLEGGTISSTTALVDAASTRFLASDVAVVGPASTGASPGYRGTWPDAVYIRMGGSSTSTAPLGTVITMPGSIDYAYVGTAGVVATSYGGIFLSKSLADT